MCFSKFYFPPSPSGTTASAGNNSFVDNTNDIWTVSGSNVVLENGIVAGATSNVNLILWFNNQIYYSDTNGNWYHNDLGTFNWHLRPDGDPRGTGFLLDFSKSQDSMYIPTIGVI